MSILPTTRPRADPDLLERFDAAGHNVECATTLLRALLADFPERPELAAELKDVEHAGDRIAHGILRHVAQHDRTCPLDTVDVHALTSAIDDIVDFTEEAADRLLLYQVEAPMEQAQRMAAILERTGGMVAAALAGWRAGVDITLELVAIHRLENDADALVRQAVASLFAIGIDPMLVIRWKDIFEAIESAVDACETVANVLEGISLKQAAHARG